MSWSELRERLRRILAAGPGAATAVPLTATDAARILRVPPRNRVQEIVHRALARLFPPTEPPTQDDHAQRR